MGIRNILDGNGERLFETFTVHEFLWEYHEPTADDLNSFDGNMFNGTTFGLFYGVGRSIDFTQYNRGFA